MATTEYVDLALLKAQLGGITSTDANRDALLTDAIEAASRRVDSYCARRFWKDDAASARTYRPGVRIYEERFFVDDCASVSEVAYGNAVDGWTVLDAEDFEVGPENATARGVAIESVEALDGWPSFGRRDRVRVTGVWGWPEVPAEVVEATLILAARYYKRQQSPEGVLGNAEWGTVRLSKTDPDVADLLSPFVIFGAA